MTLSETEITQILKEKQRETKRRYYELNRERILTRNRLWKKENREHVRKQAKEYWKRKKGVQEKAT